MLFSVVAVSCLLAVHAAPQAYMGGGLDILEDMVGTGLGRGRGIGGMEQSGSHYGRQGSVGSSNGYGSRGYENEEGSRSHDIGHMDRDYKQITESHVSEGHNSGHSEGYGNRGHASGGHSSYGAGEDMYGGGYYSGIGV